MCGYSIDVFSAFTKKNAQARHFFEQSSFGRDKRVKA